MRYPKTYATIIRAHPDGRLDARTDQGALIRTHVRQRNGYGPSATLVPGARIKCYRRPVDRSWHFRKVGS